MESEPYSVVSDGRGNAHWTSSTDAYAQTQEPLVTEKLHRCGNDATNVSLSLLDAFESNGITYLLKNSSRRRLITLDVLYIVVVCH